MRPVCGGTGLRIPEEVSAPLNMKELLFTVVLIFLLVASLSSGGETAAQGRGRGAAPGAAAQTVQPTVFLGCAAGGNLQPVEQPFMLEPAEPFILIDVLNRDASAFTPTNYRITGINMTPWLGMRVRVEGAVVEPRPGASGTDALPEIKATRVTSTWGTCPSPAAWRPPGK